MTLWEIIGIMKLEMACQPLRARLTGRKDLIWLIMGSLCYYTFESSFKYTIRKQQKGGLNVQLQNSYIFLMHPHKKEEIKNAYQAEIVHLNLDNSFISHLGKVFPTAIRQRLNENSEWFKYKYTCQVEVDEKNFNVSFFINEVADTYYMDIIVVGKNKIQIVKCLEYLQNAIKNSDISNDYIEIISYDAISEYYCNKIYPKLNELERTLRKLFFNIYVVNFGADYYRATISDELPSKAKRIIQIDNSNEKRNKNQDETLYLQKFFYSLELGDIKNILFTNNCTQYDTKLRGDFLKSHENLSDLSDEELRNFISNIAPKSDWERFFANKIHDLDCETIIEGIRKSRNNIAHCKFFYQVEYATCNKAMEKLISAVKIAIDLTEQKDFSEKNKDLIINSLSGPLMQLSKEIERITLPFAQLSENFNNIMAPCREIFSKFGDLM